MSRKEIAEREAGMTDEQLSGITKGRRRALIKQTQKAILADPVYEVALASVSEHEAKPSRHSLGAEDMSFADE